MYPAAWDPPPRPALLTALIIFATASAAAFTCPNNAASYYPDPKNGDKYYECSDDAILVHATCPDGLDFNAAETLCVDPSQSGCTNILQVAADEAKAALPPQGGKLNPSFDCSSCKDGIADGALVSDCVSANGADRYGESYIQCVNGVAYTVLCGEDGKFNPGLGGCVASAIRARSPERTAAPSVE